MCFGTAAFDTDTFHSSSFCNFISEGRPSYPLSSDVIICVWGRVNRFRVMIDFLRYGSAYPVFCKTLRFSGLYRGHV